MADDDPIPTIRDENALKIHIKNHEYAKDKIKIVYKYDPTAEHGDISFIECDQITKSRSTSASTEQPRSYGTTTLRPPVEEFAIGTEPEFTSSETSKLERKIITKTWTVARDELYSVGGFFEGALRFDSYLSDSDPLKGNVIIGPLPYRPEFFKQLIMSHAYGPNCGRPKNYNSDARALSSQVGSEAFHKYGQQYMLCHMYLWTDGREYIVEVFKKLPRQFTGKELVTLGYFSVLKYIYTNTNISDDAFDDILNVLQTVAVDKSMDLSSDFMALLDIYPTFSEKFRAKLGTTGGRLRPLEALVEEVEENYDIPDEV